jgi:hypothetical protein
LGLRDDRRPPLLLQASRTVYAAVTNRAYVKPKNDGDEYLTPSLPRAEVRL